MNKTQAQFSVEVLKTAVTTIARYETNGPPQGEVLQRLRAISLAQGFDDLAARFDHIYWQDFKKPVQSQLTWDLTTGSGDLFAKLKGEVALRAAQGLMTLLGRLESPDPKVRKQATAALKTFSDAAAEDAVDQVRKAFFPKGKPSKRPR